MLPYDKTLLMRDFFYMLKVRCLDLMFSVLYWYCNNRWLRLSLGSRNY